ncbi:tetratricopeptide repeat protein [Candidatus Poribacteria bacterium]|nr:tetratricopeptide repeat protein [Candidatus Poribacteria bacterium]
MKAISIILNSLVFIAFTSSLEADEALHLADSFFDLQNYNEAITEYKRFIFFNPEDERVGYAFYKIGMAYRAEHDWLKAIDALKTSIQKADNDKLKDERRIELGITLIASGNYSLAQLELLNISEFSRYDSMKKRASYFQGVAYLYTFNWESARRAFKAFYSNSEQQLHSEEAEKSSRIKWEEIDSLLIEAQQLPYKSVTIAKTLSTILPGSGQIYAGNRKNGLNAMVLNSVTTALMLNAIIKKRRIDSVIFLSLFQRYYLGNRYHAGEYVRQYNENLKRQQAAKILRILLESQPG